MNIKEAIAVAVVIVAFLAASYLAQVYSDSIKAAISVHNTTGMMLYFAVTTIAVVVAPVSTLPLLPIAVSLWGVFVASVLSIAGWTIGAMIVFWLASRFGRPFVHKIVSLKKIEEIERRIPEKNLFWSVVFLRMALPVDILSYALGLFTTMRFVPYSVATLLGVTPFAFVFAYASGLHIIYQIGAGTLAMAILIFGVQFTAKREKAL